jgi:hypothetical protein
MTDAVLFTCSALIEPLERREARLSVGGRLGYLVEQNTDRELGPDGYTDEAAARATTS